MSASPHTTYHTEITGSGAPLVLLHGFTGCTRNWDEVVPLLAPHYQVVTLDILGHGQTDSPAAPMQYSMENVAAAVTAVLSELLTTRKCHLLGYSMGGRLALYIAIHYPHLVQSLTLESSSPGLATQTERATRQLRDNALAERIEQEGIIKFVDFWERLPLWDSQKVLPEPTRQRLRQLRLQNNPVGLANSLRGMGTGVQPPLWSKLAHLSMPVQLITGKLDKKFVAINRQMAGHLPQSKLEIVAGAGHTVHLERPFVYAQHLHWFTRQI